MVSGLKVFHGFQLELASDYSGLSTGEIRALRQNGLVSPEKTKEGFRYSFSDLLVLRLVRVLKAEGIRLRNIASAHKYLKGINPDKSLASYKLYIDDSAKSILYVGEQPQTESLVDATKFGQLALKNLLTILPVGKYLEQTRQEVRKFDSDLHKGLHARKTIPLNTFLRKYGS